MEHVFFKPWIGENYKTGGIFKKKILVVGEGHVCGGCDKCGLKYAKECEDLNTPNVVNEYLNQCSGKWTSTYRKFERSLVNKETTPEESIEIWQSIAFFNFLQVAMTEARKSGTNDDYREGQIAFLEVIEELKPDLIIVWGVGRLYNWLPDKGWLDGDNIDIDGYTVKNGYYKLNNGMKSRLIAVYHPSVGYDWSWWYENVISKEL